MTAVIVTHGGVGAPDDWSDGCERAAEAAIPALSEGSALEAVVAAAMLLEDDPRFNAGTGSRLRLDGGCEMDAGLMDSEGHVGAVAAITGVRNPIRVALAVLQRTPHSLIVGRGANELARTCGVPPASVITPAALEKLEKARRKLRQSSLAKLWKDATFKGTIGAVARTMDGRFAVSCSTGGTALMLPGRVGDSPLVGAGLYAGPEGAVCCTGAGEAIIARLSAFRIYQAIEKGADPEDACGEEVAAYDPSVPFGVIAVTKTEHATVANMSMPAGVQMTASQQ